MKKMDPWNDKWIMTTNKDYFILSYIVIILMLLYLDNELFIDRKRLFPFPLLYIVLFQTVLTVVKILRALSCVIS